jgi:hypothetical protein
MKDPDYLGGQALGDAIPADPSSGAEHSPILTVLATLLAELSDNAPPNVSSGGVPSEHLLSWSGKRFRNAAAAVPMSLVPETNRVTSLLRPANGT